MVFTTKYDCMTDGELRELPSTEIKAFLEFFAQEDLSWVTEADLSPGERRLFRLLREAYPRWAKQREALSRLDTKRMRPQ
jgi:hypothetical protein